MKGLQFIGGGRMAEALLSGLLSAGTVDGRDVSVVELSAARRAELVQRFPLVQVMEHPAACASAILATKPGDACEALASTVEVGVHRVLSIAAGMPIARLREVTHDDVTVMRAMPNTPALVGTGAAALCADATAKESDLDWARSVLEAVGTVEIVPELLMDAVTGLSGSGPAYVMLVAEAMIEAGVLAGLPRAVADRLTRQTLLGSATMLSGAAEAPEQLRAMVTSPGGTTAAGLMALEERAVRAAICEAIMAATTRSAELGGDSRR